MVGMELLVKKYMGGDVCCRHLHWGRARYPLHCKMLYYPSSVRLFASCFLCFAFCLFACLPVFVSCRTNDMTRNSTMDFMRAFLSFSFKGGTHTSSLATIRVDALHEFASGH